MLEFIPARGQEGPYFTEYGDAYAAALTLAATEVPPKERAAATAYWETIDGQDTLREHAAAAARRDITGIFENSGYGDLIHEALDERPLGKAQMQASEAPQDIEPEVPYVVGRAELTSRIRRALAVTLSGALGLGACGVALRYDPRVATTLLEHSERAGVWTMLATVGWGSVAATGGGLISAYGSACDRHDLRRAHKAALQIESAMQTVESHQPASVIGNTQAAA